MGGQRLFCAFALLCVISGRAAADDETPPDQLRPSYLLDGGAIPFLWLPLTGTLLVDHYAGDRVTPLWFSLDEGGAPSERSHELPGGVITLGAAGIVGAIALGDDPSRFYHAKGMAESLASSGFAAVSLKRIFGRHRPDYDPSASGADGRHSFPSGHTTQAFSALTYTALYLRYHGFDQWREPGTLPWWEVATYTGLGTLAVGLGAERVYHNRHHVTDVVAGGLLGTASSVALFYYQEHRYRSAKQRKREVLPLPEPKPFMDPVSAREAKSALPGFDPVFSFGTSF